MQDLTGCRGPGKCRCNICTRQPSSLRDSASHIIFKFVYGISKFELTTHTTFSEYVYAVRSVMVDEDRLLPPEFPVILLCFTFDRFVHKYHRDCPNEGAWDTQLESEFTSRDAALRTLTVWKDRFWCHHCERGLFFPKTCTAHLD